ncbi:hypothetical protein GCM10011386_25500 [Parapedobacter defluvii]|uniref:Glycosyl transferase family 2 n=2 Tax=Parapedobacter defluvii TaxID=2045106 RepID=A0ABQ1M2F3_9SPHI|nr:hypothetical protein GCM10011386_25500 [Parapedobacter defluvii]
MGKTTKKIKHFIRYHIQYYYIHAFNKLVGMQRKNPLTIPVIIINFNQLTNLKNLVTFLQDRKLKNIVIIDNNSSYPPLLDYYETIKRTVTVEIMPENYGHMVFFEHEQLQQKYGQGYYVITDPDILPNPKLPSNFMEVMLKKMDKYHFGIQKVGFALEIDTIPDYFPLKEKVLNWERQYWTDELEKDVFHADIDTTFALYKPKYPSKFNAKMRRFYEAIRLGGNFTSKHMGWYLDPKNLSEEQRYYMQTSSESASWKFDEDGNLDSPSTY